MHIILLNIFIFLKCYLKGTGIYGLNILVDTISHWANLEIEKSKS